MLRFWDIFHNPLKVELAVLDRSANLDTCSVPQGLCCPLLKIAVEYEAQVWRIVRSTAIKA
jgi:hypothetical protein